MVPAMRTLVLCLTMAACVHATPDQLRYQPSSDTPPAPKAWQQVRLAPAPETAEPEPPFAFAIGSAIEQELAARLPGNAGTISLRVTEARATLIADRLGSRLGLAATFTLDGPKSHTLRIEHSVNFFEVDESSETHLVAVAIRDLCDRLFHHPGPLAALGGDAPAYVDPWIDSGAGVGPILAVDASTEEADGSGRLLWPPRERSNLAGASMMLGEMKGLRGDFLSTRRTLASGLGYRAGGSILVMSIPLPAVTLDGSLGNIFGDDGVFFGGGRLSVAGEWGLAFVGRSLDGYVLTPGPRLSVLPQATGTLAVGTGAGGTLVLWNLEAGVAGEADVPMGDSFGLTGGAFAGVTYAAFTGSAHSQAGIPMFAWYPYARLYYQSARGRVSLGVSFETLTQAAMRAGGGGAKAAGMLGTPVITLAYDARTGRGLAYRGDEPAAPPGLTAGWAVKATPLAAFTSAAPTPETAESEPPAVVAAPAAKPTPPGRWVVLLRGAESLLGSDGSALIARTVGKVLHDRGARVVKQERARGTLAVLGIGEPQPAQLADIVSGLEVDHALLVEMSGNDTEVAFFLHRFDASAGSFEPVHKTMARSALLRELRAAVDELFAAPAPEPATP